LGLPVSSTIRTRAIRRNALIDVSFIGQNVLTEPWKIENAPHKSTARPQKTSRQPSPTSSSKFVMKNPFRCSLFASFVLLAGCAVQTPYQPAGFRGGFKETRVDDTTYRIRFSGNGNTSGDQVWYY
jgi:hypothetical protein